MENNGLLLKCQKICKSFGPTKALTDVDLELSKGEIRGLCGENGSGKSTLASVISGVYGDDSGSMELEGKEYVPVNQMDANRKGIFMIKQEMGTIDGLTVAENVFFGNEDRFITRGLRNIRRMNQEAKSILDHAELSHIMPALPIENYNFEQRKGIELAKAIAFDPKLLIVDETTTALSHEMREYLYRIIADLKEKGCAIVFISHDLQEVLRICDSVTVLKDGELVDTFRCADITEDDLKRAMVGRELSGDYYRSDPYPEISDEIVLSARDITIPGVVDGVSLDLHKGEILGLGGLSESGLHEFGKTLFGLDLGQTGTVTVQKNGAQIRSIHDAMRNGIGYLPKNRDQEGLFLYESIHDNITIANIDKIGTPAFISPLKARAFAKKQAEDLRVKMLGTDQQVSALSGGNKQKVSLAKWMGRDAEILVLDSPTRGIDVMVKAQIYHEMMGLKEKGVSVIMISEELLELIGMCDRIVVFADGKVNGEFLRDPGLTEEQIIRKMI